MIQCQDCEFYQRAADGTVVFKCDPFGNIKEPECLIKWQLIKLDTMVRSYQATLRMYERLAPMQEKMFRHMEKEIDEMDESERWKESLDDDPNVDEEKDDDFRGV